MKTFLIALLGLVALAISVQAAEGETTHIAGRGAKAPGHPGYAQVSDDDKTGERAIVQRRYGAGLKI
jgi:opacity protein-like surface antigen